VKRLLKGEAYRLNGFGIKYSENILKHNISIMELQGRETNHEKPYRELLERISRKYAEGQAQAVRSVNEAIVETNWYIGQYIVEYEQEGKVKAKYGSQLLVHLSHDLTLLHGRGFSRPNLNNMRMFYLRFPICQTLSNKLSWSHYCELIKISDDIERSFYLQQNLLENWSVSELKRQKESGLFVRLAMSKNKDEILQLSFKGQVVETPKDIVKDVYVFEFLKIPEPYTISETELETRLLDNLQTFLLELGKGFTFVGRQYRMMINNTPFRVDLVFYHRILRCFVLIDLVTIQYPKKIYTKGVKSYYRFVVNLTIKSLIA
jgi:predicted nuclease of restriction endonuclease-like (RecB) superfamily